MNKVTIVKVVAVVVGAVVALSLVSAHPVQIAILGACAAAYIYVEKVVK